MSLKKTVWLNAQRTLLNMLQFHGTHLCCYLMKHQRESMLRLLPFSATIRLFVRCLQALSVSTRSGKVRVLADDYLKIMWWLRQLISTISGWAYIFNRSALYPVVKDSINYPCNDRNFLRYMDVKICEQFLEIGTKIWENWCTQKFNCHKLFVHMLCLYIKYVPVLESNKSKKYLNLWIIVRNMHKDLKNLMYSETFTKRLPF